MRQKTELEIGVRNKATGELDGISAAFNRMKVSVESNKAGLNRLDGALKDSARNLIGLQGSAGQVATGFLQFAPQSLAITAAIAGIALVINKLREARDEREKLAKLRGEALVSGLEAQVKSEATTTTIRQGETRARLAQFESENRTLGNIVRTREQEVAALDKLITRYTRLASGGSVVYTGRLREVKLQKDILVNGQKETETTEEIIGLYELQARQTTANLQLQQTRLKFFTEEVQNITDLNAAYGVSSDRTRRLSTATAELQRIAATVSFSDEMRLAALNVLNGLEKDRLDISKKTNEEQKKFKEQERAEERYTSELLKKELDARFRIQMKYYEDLSNAREMSRNFIQQDLQAELSRGLAGVSEGLSKDEEQAQKLNDLAKERMETITTTVNSVADGLDVMTQGLIDGQNGFLALGNGAKAAARGILRAFAQEQIAKGVGALGDAFKATASGNFLSAGLFTKSAAKYFAAAALAGVGAGAIGGGAGAGIGAGGFSNTQLGRINFQGQQPLTIVVQGGLLDMSNPDTQRSFIGALETVSNRRIKFSTVGA